MVHGRAVPTFVPDRSRHRGGRRGGRRRRRHVCLKGRYPHLGAGQPHPSDQLNRARGHHRFRVRRRRDRLAAGPGGRAGSGAGARAVVAHRPQRPDVPARVYAGQAGPVLHRDPRGRRHAHGPGPLRRAPGAHRRRQPDRDRGGRRRRRVPGLPGHDAAAVPGRVRVPVPVGHRLRGDELHVLPAGGEHAADRHRAGRADQQPDLFPVAAVRCPTSPRSRRPPAGPGRCMST